MKRAPTTLHEHFRADPRGADSFKRWIEDRIWELFAGPGSSSASTLKLGAGGFRRSTKRRTR